MLRVKINGQQRLCDIWRLVQDLFKERFDCAKRREGSRRITEPRRSRRSINQRGAFWPWQFIFRCTVFAEGSEAGWNAGKERIYQIRGDSVVCTPSYLSRFPIFSHSRAAVFTEDGNLSECPLIIRTARGGGRALFATSDLLRWTSARLISVTEARRYFDNVSAPTFMRLTN
jgi:hypothetical protein